MVPSRDTAASKVAGWPPESGDAQEAGRRGQPGSLACLPLDGPGSRTSPTVQMQMQKERKGGGEEGVGGEAEQQHQQKQKKKRKEEEEGEGEGEDTGHILPSDRSPPCRVAIAPMPSGDHLHAERPLRVCGFDSDKSTDLAATPWRHLRMAKHLPTRMARLNGER